MPPRAAKGRDRTGTSRWTSCQSAAEATTKARPGLHTAARRSPASYTHSTGWSV